MPSNEISRFFVKITKDLSPSKDLKTIITLKEYLYKLREKVVKKYDYATFEKWHEVIKL